MDKVIYYAKRVAVVAYIAMVFYSGLKGYVRVVPENMTIQDLLAIIGLLQ